MVDELGTQIIDNLDEREAWLEKIQFLSDAMEATSQPFCAAGCDGSILVFNEAFCRLTGYTREELHEINWVADLTAPESMECEFRALSVLDQTHRPQRYENGYRRKDGTVVSVELLVDSASDSEGHTLFYYAFITDITERKLEEERLLLTQFAVDNFTDSMIWLDERGRITYVNDATCRSTGYGRNELLSMYIWDIDPEYSPERYARDWKEWGETGGRPMQNRFESVHRTRNGILFPVEITRRFITFKGRKYVVTFDRDITERKRAEEALAKDRYNLMKSQEVAHVGNWAWDIDTGDLTGSVENDQIFGFVPGEDPRTIELVRLRAHPDDLSIIDNFAADVTLRGKRESIDYRIVKPDGSVRYVNTIADKMDRDESGKITRVYGISQDITERKLAEEVLRESEDKFRTLAESAPAAIYIIQSDRLKYLNKAAEKITGYPNEERLNTSANAIIHPDFQELALKRNLARERGEPVPSQYEIKIVTKSGEVKWVLNSAGRIVYEGKPAILGTMFDITERKQAEEALRESEEMFRAFAESARAEIVLIKGDRFVYVNPERIRALGYTKEELLAMKVEDTIHPDMRALVRDRVRRRLRGEPQPSQYEVKMITKSGETVWEELSSTVIDYKGEPTILSMSFNITARKRAETALKEAKMQAELYLDLMSHDITNMNQALMGNLEIMEIQSETGEIDKELIDSSLKTINRSSRMIDDVKKLTQVLAGGVSRGEADVCKLLEAVRVRYSVGTGRSVTINYTPGESCIVKAGDLLEDVFDNLVDNAIRHSTGPVIIDLAVDRVSLEGHQYYRISVADTGPGIPDDLKKKIFLTIEEIGAGEKLKRRGFGLFLVRTLISYYDGKVWVEDRVPADHTKGAKFVVMLPAVEK